MSEPDAAAALLLVQRALRHAPSENVLRFSLVSEPRHLVDYRQALLLERGATGRLRVAAVSNVAVLDPNAPYLVFVERWLGRLDRAGMLAKSTLLTGGDATAEERVDWHELLADHVLWQPLATPAGDSLGGLLLVRSKAWEAAEAVLLEEVADAGAHAWQALGRPRRLVIGLDTRRRVGLAAAAAAIALLCLPVRLSAIAPAEVAARAATVLAAPIDGVIRDIHVEPNAEVARGDLLWTFEDAELRANHAIDERAVSAAAADLHRASQQAFADPRGRAEVALLQARLALRKEQSEYSAYRLGQVEMRAPTDGIVIFDDPNQWRGRPVSTGERVMLLAAPSEAELLIHLPVADAIHLEPEAPARVFLDVKPLEPVDATLERASYAPVASPDGVLAYRLVARFASTDAPPRIGLQGSAKVWGDRVPLWLLLFRRPLSALRQTVGL